MTCIREYADGRKIEYRRATQFPSVIILEHRELRPDGTPHDDRWYRVSDAHFADLSVGSDIIQRLTTTRPHFRTTPLTPADYIHEQAEILEDAAKRTQGELSDAERHEREVLSRWFDHHGDDAEWAMERGDAAEVEKLAADLRKRLDVVETREKYAAMVSEVR